MTYVILTHVVVKDILHLFQMTFMNLVMLLVDFEMICFEKFSNMCGKSRKAVKRKIKILTFDTNVEYAPIEMINFCKLLGIIRLITLPS